MNDEVKNPFPGLRPFEFEDNHLFFGRDEQTTELTTRLRKNRFVAVVGTSGSGKSSLVRAGLLPELLSGTMSGVGSSWETAIMRPGGDPLTNLANSIIEADLYDPDEEEIVSQVRATLTRSGLGLVEAMRQSDLPEGTNFLLVVDQFEEIFRFRRSDDATDEQAAFFVNLLLEASSQSNLPLYVIITMRSDFLGECSQFPRLADTVNEGEFLIPRLNRDQRKEAIIGPVKVAGGNITDRLLLRLLNDIGDDPDQLPILQHALMRTWDLFAEQGDKGDLDLEHYNATGGMTEALSRHADEIYNEQPDDEHKRIAQKLFKSLTEKVDANRGIRRPMALVELHEICGGDESHLRNVVDSFRRTGCTFLMPTGEREISLKSIIDISHESLMRVWISLRNWVDEEAQSAKIYRRLADTATLFKQEKAGLYRDPDLQIALSWREENRPNKTWADRYYPGFDDAMAFLDDSQEESVREERAREEARQREVAQAKALAKARARSAAIFKFACIGVTLLAITAIYAMIEAQKSRDEADRQIINLAKRSIAAGETMDNEKDHLGALVWYADAIGLAKKDPDIQSKYQDLFRSKLDSVVKIRHLFNLKEPIKYASFLPNGSSAVVITNNGNFMQKEENKVYIIDFLLRQKNTIYSCMGEIRGAKINSGKNILSFLEDNIRTYSAIDLSSGKIIFRKQLSYPTLRSPIFNDEGTRLLVGGSMQDIGGSLSVFELNSAKLISKKDFSGRLSNMTFISQNQVGFSTGKVNYGSLYTIWDYNNKNEDIIFNEKGQDTGVIRSIKRERERKNLIATVVDYRNSPQEVTYIKVIDNQSKNSLYETTKGNYSLNFPPVLSSNNKYMALARTDGIVEVHDLKTFTKIWQSEGKQTGNGDINSLKFSPDGSLLLATGSGRNIGLWNVINGSLVTSSLEHESLLIKSDWNKLGNAFLTSTRNGVLRVYETPNLKLEEYMQSVKINADTAFVISKSLSSRVIEDGRMISLDKNNLPDLSTPELNNIYQFNNPNDMRKWHISMAQLASSNHRWSSVKFHLDKSDSIKKLNRENLQLRFDSHINLGLYKLAKKDLVRIDENNFSKNPEDENKIPNIAQSWEQNIWYFSDFYSCPNLISGYNQDHINSETLELNGKNRWSILPKFSPKEIPSNFISEKEIYVNAPENSVYYLAKVFTIQDEGLYNLEFDSDDLMKVWINGKHIHSYTKQPRGMFNSKRDSSRTRLRNGNNIIIIKVVNGILASGAYFNILEKNSDTTNINKAYLNIATNKKIDTIINPKFLKSSKDILRAALISKDVSNASSLKQQLIENNVGTAVINGQTQQLESYIKPKKLVLSESLSKGFTLQCFIKQSNRWGSRHIFSNGGSYSESGFSILTHMSNGGVIKAEFQNIDTNEKVLLESSYPFDDKWHHVALTYDANKKSCRFYLDGNIATDWTDFKSPLVFNSDTLRIGDNQLRGKGFGGGSVSDLIIWPEVLNEKIIKGLSNGASTDNLGPFVLKLDLRFNDLASTINNDLFYSENITWEKNSNSHPLQKSDPFYIPVFKEQISHDKELFAAIGIIEYRLGNYFKSLELLIRSENDGRYSSDINFHPYQFLRAGKRNGLDPYIASYIVMAYKKCGFNNKYENYSAALNNNFNSFEMITNETINEMDVYDRIQLKSLQREINSTK